MMDVLPLKNNISIRQGFWPWNLGAIKVF